MPTVNVQGADSQLSHLLTAALAGEEVIIAREGKPVARLVPLKREVSPRRLGSLNGKITVPADFDAPLPDDVLAAFEGR